MAPRCRPFAAHRLHLQRVAWFANPPQPSQRRRMVRLPFHTSVQILRHSIRLWFQLRAHYLIVVEPIVLNFSIWNITWQFMALKLPWEALFNRQNYIEILCLWSSFCYLQSRNPLISRWFPVFFFHVLCYFDISSQVSSEWKGNNELFSGP